MIRKGILIMLCMSLIMGVIAGCDAAAPTGGAVEQTAAPTETTEAIVETTEEPWPDDGAYRAYYDDRIPITELGGNADSVVEIVDQQVESLIVGSAEQDTAVVYYDKENAQFIVVGTGVTTVSIDGTQKLIRARAAAISLFMITGHSLGAGQCGNGAQSVMIEAGQAYSCHKTATFQEATAEMGIGFAAATKPAGIDAFAPGGGGTIGEASALAWKWNQLTGEKVWVLNAAVGGSVIPEWHKGQTYYEPAVKMYRAAAQVLSNEVKAGHYVLKNTCVIYHSGANFGYKNVEYTDEIMEYWYDSMINGFREDLAMDINGDGTPETVDSIGIVPHGAGSMNDDKPINYYLAASDKYPNVYIVSKTIYAWRSDELLQSNFPEIDYATQSESVEKPTLVSQLKAEDGVHLTQVGYNAAGLSIGENLYNYFRNDRTLESFQLVDENGNEVKDEIKMKRKGASEVFRLFTEPCYVSDLTITLSDNLEMISPFVVKATAEGEGFITISYKGEELRHIVVKVGD